MFDTMISKTLIQWIWLGWSGLIALAGLIALIQSGSRLEALFILVGTALALGVVRVLCEGMIVIFMIHENLAGSRIALEKIQAVQDNAGGRNIAPANTAHHVPQRPAQASAPLVRTPAAAAVSSVVTSDGENGSDIPDAIKKDDYHDRMTARRDQLQREAQQSRNH